MKVRYMDEQELEIAKLDNILSIVSYSIFSSTDNLPLIGFEVKYIDENGNTKNIRYFTDDKCYLSFVKRVYEYYIAHENEFTNDEDVTLYLDKKDVKRKIDNRSKRLFDSIDKTLCKEKITKVFESSFKQEISTFGDNTREIESHLNSIIHELSNIFSLLNKEFSVPDKVHVYNNNFVINAVVDGHSTVIPVYYEKLSDEEYKFSFGNIFRPGFLVMDITYTNEKVSIYSRCNSKKLSSYSTYTFGDTPYFTNEIYTDSELISYTKEDIKPTTATVTLMPYFEFIQENIHDFTFYHLPSGDIYAVNLTSCENEDVSKKGTRRIKFSISNGKYHIRDSYVLELKSDKTIVHANGFSIDTTMIKSKDEYLIESVFLDTLASSGEYKKDYSGKVVYRVLRENKTHELKNLDDINVQRLYLRGEK